MNKVKKIVFVRPPKRHKIQARFDIPAEIQLKELQRRKMAEPAARAISDALGLLFAHNPESFPESLRKVVLHEVGRKMPGSLEAWKQYWKG